MLTAHVLDLPPDSPQMLMAVRICLCSICLFVYLFCFLFTSLLLAVYSSNIYIKSPSIKKSFWYLDGIEIFEFKITFNCLLVRIITGIYESIYWILPWKLDDKELTPIWFTFHSNSFYPVWVVLTCLLNLLYFFSL